MKVRLFLLFTWLGLISTGRSADRDPITVFTAEIGTSRRIVIDLGDCRAQSPDWIQVEEDSATGRFTIALGPLDSVRYFGKRRLHERGVVPVQLTVATDSSTIRLQGKTLPFAAIQNFWLPRSNTVVVDFYQQEPAETIFLEQTLARALPPAMARIQPRSPGLVSLEFRTDTYSRLLKRAVLYALIVFGFALALWMVFRLRGKTRPADSALFVQEPEEPALLHPEPSGEESKKKAIKKIMDETGQTWDEAALSYALQQQKAYERV